MYSICIIIGAKYIRGYECVHLGIQLVVGGSDSLMVMSTLFFFTVSDLSASAYLIQWFV